MDAAMAQHYGALHADAGYSSLHDEFLHDIQETGLSAFAAEIGIIDANGQLPGVRVQGDRLLEAASIAATKAAEAAEATRQRMQSAKTSQTASGSPSMEAGPSTAATTPPTKPARNKSSRPSRGSNSGGDQAPAGRTNGKGLRHFSMKALANQVCEKVESKQRTTYNEVADELVSEFGNVEGTGSPGGTQYDEKNIRRRVYDALNVLIAMEIISRSKKEILWHGLPSGHGNVLERTRAENIGLNAQIDKQQNYLQELLKTQTALRNLIKRNRDLPVEVLAARNKEAHKGPTALQLPFILIQANAESHVEIQISDDSRHAHFDFHSSPFKIHGDDEVLRHMGLHLDNPPPTLPPHPSMQIAQMLPAQSSHQLLQTEAATHMMPEQTTPQVQMQIEADQQLAALQQQSQPTHQRDWGNGPTGNVQLFHGHQPNGNMNGARPHDGVGMMSQESPIMEDSPPNQARFAGQRVPVTPKGQSLSPGLHGMALSPGTLLPQLPLHGMHMSQASLISPSHGQTAPWQYSAQSHGNLNGHHQNGYSSGLAHPDMMPPHPHAKQESQSMCQVPANRRGLSHDAAAWSGQYGV
ncbi:hypothetical protein ABBQ32_004274 [Trebouxia sp. C0010 RCD-2024]